ncbi:class I SAM-dependent methyltransferase [Paracoccaceae bacterium]|nr:class I SAM-dependent methyltransferase [Paracoccaceae bacterium]
MNKIADLKEKAKIGWASFISFEALTSTAAPKLVEFASVNKGMRLLDVACGTGVVALTASRAGAQVEGIDLTPELISRANENSKIMGLEAKFIEGDAESLPYEEQEFDIILSQYGHMFAPRPEVVTDELARVLKPGGILAFSTWPKELFMGKFFKLIEDFSPPLPAEVASPVLWGDMTIIQGRLENKFEKIEFGRDTMYAPTMSPAHMLKLFEKNAGPLANLVKTLADDPDKLTKLRNSALNLIEKFFSNNFLKQDFLMTRCIKKSL